MGFASAGYTVLSRGFRSPKILVDAYRRPRVPYAAGQDASVLGASAMIDISDGLISDLGHIAEASGVGMNVDSGSLVIPDQMRDAASALGVDPYMWILAGGDDHALAATFPPDVEMPPQWLVIGEVTTAQPGTSGKSAITVDGRTYTGPTGWDHFGR